jgi:transcriptional regulator of acetoin/glycerol metabolism
MIREALRATGGNRAHAARLLGISRATMYRRLRELGAGLES